MEILDYIPVGQKNAVTRKRLSILTGLSDRKIRELIEKVNEGGSNIVINLQDGRGYFVPDEDEGYLVRIYRRQEQKRFLSLKNKLESINKILEGGKGKNGMEGQYDLSEYMDGGLP